MPLIGRTKTATAAADPQPDEVTPVDDEMLPVPVGARRPANEDDLRAPPVDVDAQTETAEDDDEAAAPGRSRLYRQHMFSAYHFAENARALERGATDEITQEEKWNHRALVTGSILTAAAFLEASINELYLELQNLSQSGQPRLPPRELALLLRVWPEVKGSPILHKYQVALSISDADTYDESKTPFVDADSVIRLRDALLSCTTEWEDSRGRHRTLEKRLRTKFPVSTLVSADAPWFPDRCLGAGCARWAVKTAQVFSDDFSHRMGIPSRARVGKEVTG